MLTEPQLWALKVSIWLRIGGSSIPPLLGRWSPHSLKSLDELHAWCQDPQDPSRRWNVDVPKRSWSAIWSGHGLPSAADLCLDHSTALACFLELPCHFLFTPSSGMKDRYVDLFMSRPSRRNQTMRSFCSWSLFRVGLSFSFPLLGVVFSSLCLALRVFASALFWQPGPVHGPNAIFAHDISATSAKEKEV